jgi:hypothetical protein
MCFDTGHESGPKIHRRSICISIPSHVKERMLSQQRKGFDRSFKVLPKPLPKARQPSWNRDSQRTIIPEYMFKLAWPVCQGAHRDFTAEELI